jgi:hypothetical protein
MGAVKTDSRNMAAGFGAFGEPRTMVARPGVAEALSLSHFLPHAVWSVCDLLDSAEGFLFCFVLFLLRVHGSGTGNENRRLFACTHGLASFHTARKSRRMMD